MLMASSDRYGAFYEPNFYSEMCCQLSNNSKFGRTINVAEKLIYKANEILVSHG